MSAGRVGSWGMQIAGRFKEGNCVWTKPNSGNGMEGGLSAGCRRAQVEVQYRDALSTQPSCRTEGRRQRQRQKRMGATRAQK